MKPGWCWGCLVSVGFAAVAVPAYCAETIDQLAARATLDYTERLKQAETELTGIREHIAAEKAPLLDAMRAAEDRLSVAEAAILRLKTADDRRVETRAQLQREASELRKNLTYVASLARDAEGSIKDGFVPGEEQIWGAKMSEAQRAFETAAADAPPVLPAVELLLSRLRRNLGGYTAPGKVVMADTNEVVAGTLAFFGPETFFLPPVAGRAGSVRLHEGSEAAFNHPVTSWDVHQVEAFFRGELGAVPGDGSGGKALRLQETRGDVWDHVRKGGIVSYAIIAVGLVALLLIVNKIVDLVRLQVIPMAEVRRFLAVLANDSRPAVDQSFQSLSGAVRDLYAVGLTALGQAKDTQEEQLWAVLLQLRLHAERRLPLLSVIAVAAPLMGLLGTVTGMVRTFALITVFGTGNAGKLASGISEVLVSTELGLLVAIPALIAHGFLASALQKKLARLEGCALEFVTAAQQRTAGPVATIRPALVPE